MTSNLTLEIEKLFDDHKEESDESLQYHLFGPEDAEQADDLTESVMHMSISFSESSSCATISSSKICTLTHTETLNRVPSAAHTLQLYVKQCYEMLKQACLLTLLERLASFSDAPQQGHRTCLMHRREQS